MVGELKTVEETAKILRVRCETVRRYIKDGFLNAHSLPGGNYRIPESELQLFLNKTDGVSDTRVQRTSRSNPPGP